MLFRCLGNVPFLFKPYRPCRFYPRFRAFFIAAAVQPVPACSVHRRSSKPAALWSVNLSVSSPLSYVRATPKLADWSRSTPLSETGSAGASLPRKGLDRFAAISSNGKNIMTVKNLLPKKAASAVLLATTALAGTAIANHKMAKSAQRKHPPEGQFLTVDGVRLHYVDSGGDNSPVVLLHGNGTMIADMANQWIVGESMATASYHCFRPTGVWLQ
jgi:hypothetical protein